jgi:hypothetical protein
MLLVGDGTLTWDQAMEMASNDTARLLLLDLASTIRQEPRSFVDDTHCPVASQGHAARAIQVMEDVASEEQYCYKSDKMKITAKAFTRKQPIDLQGAPVNYADSVVALGFTSPQDYTGECHLAAILKQGRSTFARVYASFAASGLPMQAMLKAMPQRITPASLFGGQLIIHNPSTVKLVNKLQAQWMHTILGVHKNLPRIVMMWEVGLLDRASAILWMRAVSLWIRIHHDPKYEHERVIVSVAHSQSNPWCIMISDMVKRLAVGAGPMVSADDSPGTIKRKFSAYNKDVINTAVRTHEMQTWNALPKHKEYWMRFDPNRWTIGQLSNSGLPVSDFQLWANLKLQGGYSHWTQQSLVEIPPTCRFCHAPVQENVEHLLSGCSETSKRIIAKFTGQYSNAKLAHKENRLAEFVLGYAPTFHEAVACVAFAAELGRAARKQPEGRVVL